MDLRPSIVRNWRSPWIIGLVVAAVVAVLAFATYRIVVRVIFSPTPSNVPSGASLNTPATTGNVAVPPTVTAPPGTPPDDAPDTEVVLRDLDIPWALGITPDGTMLITQRAGQLLLVGENRTPIAVDGVEHVGEGGLLGLALHPDFAKNGQLYLYMTTAVEGGLQNRIERYRLDGTTLVDRTSILEDIPGAAVHDGGRMAFGPDGKLYVGTGDAGDGDNAQDRTSLAGKILRLNDDGSIPDGNPFDSAIWSYGHRNVQGFTWDDQGRMWATEHGPSGGGADAGQDELNLIEAGANYGWPVIKGDATAPGMRAPIIHSGVSDTWAPSGATFYDGSVFFAGLRGESIFEAKVVEGTGGARPTVELTAHFRGEFGRLRTVLVGQDGFLYALTNNTDGRGSPRDGDDKLIRFHPRVFRR